MDGDDLGNGDAKEATPAGGTHCWTDAGGLSEVEYRSWEDWHWFIPVLSLPGLSRAGHWR